MINVVGRPPLDAAGVRLCTFEHVLCDTSSMPCDYLPHPLGMALSSAMVHGTVPITLENLSQIRRDPCCSAENFVLDSCEDAARELESAFGAEGGAVVCDLTTVDEGRDVDGLARVAARLGDVAVCFGASLPAVDVARGSEDEIRVALERQLVVGVDVAADVTRNFAAGAPEAPRAAFIGPLRPAFTWDGKMHCKSADVQYIRAAAAAASRQGAPVVVVLPGYEGAQLRECARAVVELADAPAWVFRVARLDDQHGPAVAAASTRTGIRPSTRPRLPGRRRRRRGYKICSSRAFRYDADPRPACGAACEEFGVLAARKGLPHARRRRAEHAHRPYRKGRLVLLNQKIGGVGPRELGHAPRRERVSTFVLLLA